MKRLTPVFFAAAVFCGCGSSPKWQQQTFAFSTPADPPAANTGTNIVELSHVLVSPLFQSREFTYRTGEDTYEHDPYAGFLSSPERTLSEAIETWMRRGGAFGHVVEPGSGLTPTVNAEAKVTELCGDFRNPGQPLAHLEIHFTFYRAGEEGAGRVLLDRVCSRETPLSHRNAAALMAAWDADLREIMEDISSDYAKANSNDGGR
jgi:cholesterol transport system auxiliary component